MKKAQKKATAAASTQNAAKATAKPHKSAEPHKPASQSPASSAKKELTPEEKVAEKALVVVTEAENYAVKVNSLNIDDVRSEQAAVSFRNEVIKAGMQQAHELLDPIVKSAKEAYDVARGQRDKALEPFERADRLVLDALNGYYTRQRQRQRAEQEKADREQAERERQAAIQREERRKQLEEQIVEQLAALPQNAPIELIEKIEAPLREFEVPMSVAPAVRVSAPERTGNMTQQDNWKGEVIEGHEMKVLAQIVSGELPVTLIEWSKSEINRLAKLYTDKRQFPGIRFWNEPFVRGVGKR